MFIELVEVLRCVRQHDESWLVASIGVMHERSILTGALGCPVCGAQYAVAGGVVDFSDGRSGSPNSAEGEGDDDIALRAGAFLGLAEAAPNRLVVLGGSWARGAGVLTSVTGARAIAVNAPPGIAESPAVGLVLSHERLPFGKASCAGIALDDSFGGVAIESAVTCLKPGGRIVAPSGIESPQGVNVLARDGSYWVGEKAAEVTPLRRASR
jgi:hypothetical protein